MSSNNLINSVRNFLASQFMHVENEWLQGCVEYLTEDSSNNYTESEIQNLAKEQWLLNDLKDICPGSLPANLKSLQRTVLSGRFTLQINAAVDIVKSKYLTEDSSNNYTESEIQNLAKEQWLLNDLKDICPGSLPANLKSLQRTVLSGRFTLQINAAVDIGTPAYQQYMKLQKVNTENIDATTKFEDKIPNHRMIKLYLTDGVQEISAIEYKPMRNLSCDITPGCKALIKGPIECRRGVLLLTESSIELLGGEVQEIALSHSLAGLLSTKLGLPMTQGTTPDLNTTISHPRNTDIPQPHTEMPPPRTDHDLNPRPVAVVTSLQANFADDDIDIDQLTAIEAQITNPKRPLADVTSKPEKKLKIDPVTLNNVDDYPDDNDLFIEDEDYLRELESKFDASYSAPKVNEHKGPIAVSSEPFVYIKQINDMTESERAGRVFRVKGQIMKLLSKLSVGKDGWSLRCTIVDGTGSLDVDFTNNVLSKLVGFTPQEMNRLKKEMATKPELKEKAVVALQKAKDTLQVLYCIIELTILEVPKITCLIPFNSSHVDSLKRRQISS